MLDNVKLRTNPRLRSEKYSKTNDTQFIAQKLLFRKFETLYREVYRESGMRTKQICIKIYMCLQIE